MAASRAIVLALLLPSFLLLVDGSISLLTEDMLKTILEDEAFQIEIPQEKLECKELRLTTVNSYVAHISVKIVNVGRVSYSTEDLEYFDLFLILVYSSGTESDNLMREFFRVPYKGDCNIGLTPCWRVTKILSIAKPNDFEVHEMINPSDCTLAQWFWDPYEIAYIDIYVPINADPAGIFVTLVTLSGQAAKPINFINI